MGNLISESVPLLTEILNLGLYMSGGNAAHILKTVQIVLAFTPMGRSRIVFGWVSSPSGENPPALASELSS